MKTDNTIQKQGGNVIVTVYFTEAEHAWLEGIASKQGMTVAELCNHAARTKLDAALAELERAEQEAENVL